jgi:hypothetical protein
MFVVSKVPFSPLTDHTPHLIWSQPDNMCGDTDMQDASNTSARI